VVELVDTQDLKS